MNIWNRFHEHVPEFIAWVIEKKIILQQFKCQICYGSVELDYKNERKPQKECDDANRGNVYDYDVKHSINYRCCSKKEHRRSIFFNSIFYKSKMSYVNILILMYGFAYDLTYNDII